MKYAAASNGQVSYGTESTAYSKAGDTTSYFGLLTEDVTPPNPNEVTAYATGGGRRGPHVNSPDPRTYEFEIPFLVLDSNAPFEFALGDRTTTQIDPDDTSSSGDEYDEHLFTETDTLPTMTVEHQQEDLDFQQWFVGSKASLSLSASQGEALSATMELTGASREYDDAVSLGYTQLSIPQDRSPYRFWMSGDITLSDPDSGSTQQTIATVSGMELAWDNGLEARHHGNGRDAYSVVETTAAEKYDMSVTVSVVDTDLYARAADDEDPVDVEIPFYRDPSASTHRDALIVRLKECTVIDAPIPNMASGDLDAEIGLAPRDTEIEIREPVSA